MLKKSVEARDQLTDILRSQGYATYARLLQLFDFYFTDDDNVIAYMVPQKAAIVMNEKITDEATASMLVRHEILHEYLTHLERQIEFEKNHPGLKPPKGSNRLANIAADFEISNLGYTDMDKIKVRNVVMGDKILSGLVTEDEQPGWENMTFEEMYEKLLERNEAEQQEMQQRLQQMDDMDAEQLQDLMDQIEDLIDQMEQQEQSTQGSSSNSSNQKQQDSEAEGEEGEKGEDKGQSNQPQQAKGEKEDSKGSESSKLQKAAKQVGQMQQQLDRIDKDDKPFDSPAESRVRRDITARAHQIKDLLKDTTIKDRLTREVTRRIDRERLKKAQYQQQRKASSGLQRFKVSLNNFIKNEIEEKTEKSFRRLNLLDLKLGMYVPDDVEMDMPVPLINVYHDVSGSFSDPAKTEAALRAIDTLQKYVRTGKLKINVYYVTDTVYEDEQQARSRGWGANGEEIIKHVQRTKPANVIVITDSDADNCSSSVKVPGAVWLLFYDAIAPNLIANLRGAKESKHYLIEYGR